MSSPDWLADLFAAVMLVVAIVSAGRLVATRLVGRPTHVDIDVMHLCMGVAMAGMFVNDLNGIPEGLWEVVFCGGALWFSWRCLTFVRGHGLTGVDADHVHHVSHYFTHVVMALAMLDMYFVAGAATGSGGMADMGGMAMGATGSAADYGFLPLLFIFALAGSAVWELNSSGRFRESGRALPAPVLVGALGGATTGQVAAAAGPDRPAGSAAPATVWLAPRLEAGTHVVMCVAMAYMLVLLL